MNSHLGKLLAVVAVLLTVTPVFAQETQPTPTSDEHAAHHPASEETSTPLQVEIQGTVWVADEFGNSITVIDASTNEVITTLTGIEGPHNLQVSPDGESVWAVSGHDSTAVQIDAHTYTVLTAIPTGEHPAHIILTPDGTTAYITNSEDNSVTAIDVASTTAIVTIPVGEYPHGLRPSPDGNWVYVANTNGTTLSVIDTSTNSVVADIEVGQRPVQVAFSPDGEFVYVSLNAENAVGKVDVTTQTLVDTVEVGVGPIQLFVTPDNQYMLVANQGTEDNPSMTVSIVETNTFSVVNTVETGAGAHGVVIEPSGQYAYITNIYDNSVSVLDIAAQAVTTSVPTGAGPNGISFSALPASPAPAPEVALAVHAEEEEPAATSEDHEAHHPEAEATATPVPDTADGSEAGMGQMGGMDMMSMMQQMTEMMDTMMGMEMSDDMLAMMEQMRGMMDMMKSRMGTEDTAATPEAMEGGEHGMTPITSEGVPPATESIGGQPLAYILEDGVKVFELTARPVLWNILDGVTVTAWTYNGTVPGPLIRVTEGDQVRVVFTNELPEATTIHFHGNTLINVMDGVPNVTRNPIEPGETFTYEFTAGPSGTFWYHSHLGTDIQIGLGLYAPLIIDPVEPATPVPDVDVTLMLSEWRVVDGMTYPAMPMAGAEPNYFTINGRSFPLTEPINVQVGQRVRIRFINAGQFVHPMHTHGTSFQIVATDGHPVSDIAQLTKDTVAVSPGERYDIEFVATEPGVWAVHCHVLHHVTNDGAEPGGLTVVVNVTEQNPSLTRGTCRFHPSGDIQEHANRLAQGDQTVFPIERLPRMPD